MEFLSPQFCEFAGTEGNIASIERVPVLGLPGEKPPAEFRGTYKPQLPHIKVTATNISPCANIGTEGTS